MKHAKAIHAYNKGCLAIIDAFIKTYFVDKDMKYGDADWFAVGDKLDGVICIGDYFFNTSHMAECLALNVTKDQVFGYYDYSMETEDLLAKNPKRIKEGITKMNLKSWLKLKF